MREKFIVFDRDGTIINFIPYLNNPDDIKLMPGRRVLNDSLTYFSIRS